MYFSGCDVKKGNIAQNYRYFFSPCSGRFFSQQQCLTGEITELIKNNLDTVYEVLKFQSLALT